MLRLNNLTGFGGGARPLVSTLVDRTTGTNIGDMTGAGGLAASFDGNTNQAATVVSQKSTTEGYVGKLYSTGKIVDQVVCYGSNNGGYCGQNNGTITLNLRGKVGTPANGADGTLLATASFAEQANESAGRTLTNSGDRTTAFTAVFVEVSEVSSPAFNDVKMAELQIYEML